jgi:putative flippase GtrA
MQGILLNARFLKFLIVGGFNTAFNYGIYAFFLFAGLGYFVAATISFLVGLIVSYKTHGRYVFRSSGNRSFSLYVISWLFLYLTNISALGFLTRYGVDGYMAGALLIPPMAVLSYVVLRFAVFRESGSSEQ